ncbi:hypothetical protein PoB_005044300 [Plakobranchus ocellatus]|uniref:Uncharacterized protein n=1 Tax=Plakobranchus ocellatus TaxID=259542 RepID=A0AAV4BYR6_9GAST|nr:hypothetical protein PoB_005044300 [Plakobranchus ocellatus]
MLKRIEAFWVGCVYDSTSNAILPTWNNFRIPPLTRSFLKNKSFTVPTSDRLLSGYIRLGNMAILKSPIISDIIMDKYVVLRPENQTGPFPEGLITIIPTSRCHFTYCKGMCMFLGDAISHVDVKHVLQSGAEKDVPSKRDALPFMDQGLFWTHMRALEWFVTSSGTFKYRCRAFDKTHKTEAFATVNVGRV